MKLLVFNADSQHCEWTGIRARRALKGCDILVFNIMILQIYSKCRHATSK